MADRLLVTAAPDVSCPQRQARGGWWEDQLCGRCAFPIGPRNTYSNVAYPLAGAGLLYWDHSPAGWVMAGSLLVLGIGSALYHGHKTLWANRLDHLGMYLVFGALSVHGFAPAHPATPVAMLLTGALLALLLAYVVPRVSLDVQMGILVWFSALPGVLRGHRAEVMVAVGCFAVAYLAWQLDVAHRVTGKWGHALWHVLTAAAIPVLFWAQREATP